MHFAPGCRGLSRLVLLQREAICRGPLSWQDQAAERACYSDLLSVNDSDVDDRASL